MNHRRSQLLPKALPSQRGSHAVEYAIIFPIFFLLFYGAFAYGMIFTMRLSLQHAAEEGARAALRYQQMAPGQNQITLRETVARQVAAAMVDWMDGLAVPTVRAEICTIGTDCLPTAGSTVADDIACGEDLTTGCQIVVSVVYPYSSKPVFPSLPGLDLLLPTSLQGRARVLLDGRALNL
jgi:Flp pilus assembly protein TadG